MEGRHESSEDHLHHPKHQQQHRQLQQTGTSGRGAVVAYKLEKAAMWVCSSVTAAFFTTLDVCACVRLDTQEFAGAGSASSPFDHQNGGSASQGSQGSQQQRKEQRSSSSSSSSSSKKRRLAQYAMAMFSEHCAGVNVNSPSGIVRARKRIRGNGSGLCGSGHGGYQMLISDSEHSYQYQHSHHHHRHIHQQQQL